MTNPATTLVLASASPARLATLRNAGIEPRVIVADIDEPAVVEEYGGAALPAEDVALLLARRKAEVVAAQVDDALVVGCDSVLELDGEVHGKPAGPDQAVARWQRMRGREGVLHSGHWLVDTRDRDAGGTGLTTGAVASTVVRFSDISDAEIAAYVATGEPLAVAGAFTIDGLGGAFVDGVDGDPHTVVGLSLPLLRRLLAEAEVSWTSLWV
jgi:septum formation protein